MINLIKRLVGIDTFRFIPKSQSSRHELIYQESEIGGRLFGPLPSGHYRQFFNLDRYTWVLYEEWTDENNEIQSITTSYEVHDKGILKVEENRRYYYLEGEELTNLIASIRRYYETVSREMYRRDPATGMLLTV